jgi:lipopolysaccharide transport system permease protein
VRRWVFLLRELVRRDLQSRYSGSFLGVAWSFVHPLWQLLLFTFVFSTVMQISPVGERTDSFALFLFAGLLPWLAVHETLQRATTAVADNAALIKKVSFPSEVIVAAIALSALAHEAIAGAVFVAVLAFAAPFAPAQLGWLLVAVPLQLALALGLGLLLASVHVFVRDTAQVLGMLLAGWFYLTPIVYPTALVPERFRGWLALNPLTPLVGLYRRALLGGPAAEPLGVLAAAAAAAVLLSAGFWVFRRLKPAFVDAI